MLRSKLGQLNSGIDPEILQAGITLAGYHIEAGARAFSSYAKAMIDELGEQVRPYLRSWYEGVRYYPGFENKGMTSAADLDAEESQTALQSGNPPTTEGAPHESTSNRPSGSEAAI